MASAFPPSFDLIYGGAQTFTQALSDLTDGHFVISILAPAKLRPPSALWTRS